MSIDSISSSNSTHRSHFQQVRQDLSALQSDLQTSNVAQAQTDFATLLNDAPRLKNALSSAAAGTSSSNAGSLTASLGTLSTALQSGDVTGATSALTSLQQGLTGAGHHRHHHHHGRGGVGGGSPDATAVQSDMQSLSGALQSGDMAAAQAAFAQLQKDDPALALGGVISSSSTASSPSSV